MTKWVVQMTITKLSGVSFFTESEFTDRAEMINKINRILSTILESDEIEIHIAPKGEK